MKLSLLFESKPWKHGYRDAQAIKTAADAIDFVRTEKPINFSVFGRTYWQDDTLDLAAVAAGLKPACLVYTKSINPAFADELFGIIERNGGEVSQFEGAIFAGIPKNVAQAIKGYKMRTDGDVYGHQVLGLALGFPEKAVRSYMEYEGRREERGRAALRSLAGASEECDIRRFSKPPPTSSANKSTK